MQMTTVQIKKPKSDLSVWSGWQPLTGKNDFNWFMKNNKCSNMNWLPFISPKEVTTNVYKTKRPTKRSSTEWFISSIIPRDMYVRSRPKKAGKWGDARAQLQPITVKNEWTGFLPVWKQRNEFQQIKQNRAIFVWMKKNKDFIKVRRKQSYNKHLIICTTRILVLLGMLR